MNQPSITKRFWNLVVIAVRIFLIGFIGFLIIILIFPQLISPLYVNVFSPILLIFSIFFILKLRKVIKKKTADFCLGILIIFSLGMGFFPNYILEKSSIYCPETQITALSYFITSLLSGALLFFSLPFLLSGGALLFSLYRIKSLDWWGRIGLGLIILSIAILIFTYLYGPCFGPFKCKFFRQAFVQKMFSHLFSYWHWLEPLYF